MKKNAILLFVLLAVYSCDQHARQRTVADTVGVGTAKIAASPRGGDSVQTGTRSDSFAQMSNGEVMQFKWLMATYTVNLNGDNIPDTISLYSSTKDTASFDGIRITLAGYEEGYFRTTYPWTKITKWFEDSGVNELPTNKFLVSRWKEQSVILLFGSPDEVGDGSNFCIVNIKHNHVRLVLDQLQQKLDVEVPLRLFDMDGDGRPEFMYRQRFEFSSSGQERKKLGGMIGSYSPFFVYTVDDSCVLNKNLTIRYNKEHYIFAGFEYSEKIDILYPDDTSKLPRIWKK